MAKINAGINESSFGNLEKDNKKIFKKGYCNPAIEAVVNKFGLSVFRSKVYAYLVSKSMNNQEEFFSISELISELDLHDDQVEEFISNITCLVEDGFVVLIQKYMLKDLSVTFPHVKVDCLSVYDLLHNKKWIEELDINDDKELFDYLGSIFLMMKEYNISYSKFSDEILKFSERVETREPFEILKSMENISEKIFTAYMLEEMYHFAPEIWPVEFFADFHIRLDHCKEIVETITNNNLSLLRYGLIEIIFSESEDPVIEVSYKKVGEYFYDGKVF